MDQKTSTLTFLLVIIFGHYTHAWSILHLRNGATPNGASNETSRNDVEKFSSVVQDWNLVCKQLCGAGLGGPPCGPQCDEVKQNQSSTSKPNTILDPNRIAICDTLCKLNMGGSTCQCTDKQIQQRTNTKQSDEVCNSFCVENKITISGCSTCSAKTSSSKTAVLGAVAVKPAADEEVAQSSTTDGTTPNWDEVCVSLCKIGEGGALCNCDLPPFF